ncbi:MAG: ornithine carbamoyltransferase [Longibaculum muris]|uniref:ornithine carbamoyltransferase n=1 Tax=Longibaculum muris TaxID=1796628 RepID=UPI00082BFEC6|nr:ornithine carbamoyltransferase [Longibaculum muris]MBS5368113.1 ornithine carbamoyltransferase [Coprobacillus cateniformis]MED9811755.1 ornithine carbamoyltransferase [Longibaculum muris]
MVNLKGRSFLTLKDYSKEEIRYLLDLAHQLKKAKKAGRIGKTLEGKNIVLLFEKTSTRTRCAFEVAALDEGGHVTFLSNSQMGKKESIEDTAKVLGRMYDAIEFRGFKQETVEDLMKYSGVPVYNGLTDVDHPTQTLADFLTIEEHLNKPLNEVKFVFTGDIRNNVCYGLMYGAAKMGMHFVCLGPKSLQIDPEVLAYCQQEAMKSGGKIEVLDNVDEAVKGADVIYTDIWVSMGEDESLYKPRVEMLSPYKVTMEMMKKTGQDSTLFMHCLPSFHDFETEVAKAKNEQGIDIREVEDEVFRSEHSVVFDEAENRMHTIKAVMVATLGNNIDL